MQMNRECRQQLPSCQLPSAKWQLATVAMWQQLVTKLCCTGAGSQAGRQALDLMLLPLGNFTVFNWCLTLARGRPQLKSDTHSRRDSLQRLPQPQPQVPPPSSFLCLRLRLVVVQIVRFCAGDKRRRDSDCQNCRLYLINLFMNSIYFSIFQMLQHQSRSKREGERGGGGMLWCSNFCVFHI